jgi:hypothetical protein
MTDVDDLDDEPLRLPPAPTPPARAPPPILTAIVPVVGALVLWRITGSVHSLWFAALGPLVAVASFVDGLRTARRARRRAGVRTSVRWRTWRMRSLGGTRRSGAARGGVPRRGDAVRRRGRGVALGART